MSARHTATMLILTVSAMGVAFAQQNDNAPVLRGSAAFGDWRKDKPGVRRLLTLEDLPAPNATPSAMNFPDTVQMPGGAKPIVPAGFSVEMIASGLKSPRVVRVAPNGDLFVADSKTNIVRTFRLTQGGARPATSEVFAADLREPYGIAFYPPGPNPQWVYIANSDGLVRFPYKTGDLKATAKPQQIVNHIPWVHHWGRDVVISPDGKRVFYSVGSGSNVALDMFPMPLGTTVEEWQKTHPLGAAWDTEERRANVLSFDPDGKNEKIVATGLRNCQGMAVHPTTGRLWCVVNERDELGDNTPFEYATEVKDGAFYGWPWYYIGNHEDPRKKGARPDLNGKVTVPDVLMQAHSAPLQIAFYHGNQFPAEYRGSAFVTMHGSWNRGQRTGYKVVRLLFRDNKPTGEYEDFMTGFVMSDKQVWGRPVGVAVGNDGSLIVTEDGSGTIWRVSHSGTTNRTQ
jgi:glucose/arabinose dehydrogenase